MELSFECIHLFANVNTTLVLALNNELNLNLLVTNDTSYRRSWSQRMPILRKLTIVFKCIKYSE